jgi:hypothetical protein
MKHACPQAKKWLKEHPEDASAQFEFGTVYRGVKSETKQRNRYWWEQKLCVEPDKPLQADVDVDEPLTTRQRQRKRHLKKNGIDFVKKTFVFLSLSLSLEMNA